MQVENICQVAQVTACAVGYEYLLRLKADTQWHVVEVYDALPEPHGTVLQAVAVEALNRSQVIHSAVQGINHHRHQRAADIAHTQTKHFGFGMRLLVCMRAVNNLRKQVRRLELEEVGVNLYHLVVS